MSIPSKIIAWRFVTDAVCLCWRWRIYFWTSTVNLLKVDWHIHLIEWNLINLSVSVLRCVVGGRTNSECVKYAANELKLKISGMYTQSNGQGERCLLLWPHHMNLYIFCNNAHHNLHAILPSPSSSSRHQHHPTNYPMATLLYVQWHTRSRTEHYDGSTHSFIIIPFIHANGCGPSIHPARHINLQCFIWMLNRMQERIFMTILTIFMRRKDLVIKW